MAIQEIPSVAEKISPQSVETEVAVLGSMLLDKEAIAIAVENIDSSYFYKEGHKKIFEAVVNLYDQNKPVDLVTLSNELKTKELLEEVGGVSYLTAIVNSVPTSANIQHYAHIVKEKAILRALIKNATQIIAQAYETQENVDELLDRAEQLIFEISERRITSVILSLKEIVKQSIDTIDKLYQKKSYITGIPTGFVDFDAKTAGFQNSDLIIVAGRPSMGKSSLVLSMAEHASLVEKVPVAFFSLEMSKGQLVQRMLCSCARVEAQKVRTGFLSPSDWPHLTLAAGRLSEANIFIDDTPAISILELRAKARRLKSKHNIGLIVLDYLQLMRGAGRTESRQQEISEISRSLKALARELNVPLIAVSQLSRAVESRVDRRPQLSDLRESGAIEQDADVVVLLLRKEYYGLEEYKGLAEVIIAKQRNGPTGSINLAFIKEYTRFENLTKQEEDN